MQITRVREQSSQPLGEFFEWLLTDCDERNVADFELAATVIASIEADVDGPDLFAYTSLSTVVLTDRDATDEESLLSINARHGWVRLEYSLSPELVPWPTFELERNALPEVVAKTRSVVQAAVIVANVLNQVSDWRQLGLSRFSYQNRNPPMRARIGVFFRCPHCEWFVQEHDPLEWDGRRHLVCGQELEPLNDDSISPSR